mmetsp:Transcript_32364/g.29184  ORF Transcript_32364/g.29184 Transcript_32364/m.29184 type:complete len:84 (+) Transcript_32364:811-1062(+)
MSLGLVALFGHFSFVGFGTYVIYSWDIVEPMVYFIQLAGSIVLGLQFFKTYSDYSNTEFLQYLKNKELKKLCKRDGFDLEQVR